MEGAGYDSPVAIDASTGSVSVGQVTARSPESMNFYRWVGREGGREGGRAAGREGGIDASTGSVSVGQVTACSPESMDELL
jgi:hypothetical protein